MTRLETPEDLQWLEEVHKVPTKGYAVAYLKGNEDYPECVYLYARDNVNCEPSIYEPVNGKLVLTRIGARL